MGSSGTLPGPACFRAKDFLSIWGTTEVTCTSLLTLWC